MSLVDRWQQSMMDNYGTPPLALVRGEGATVWDEAGQSYVDLLGGIAVNVLGHAHPAVVAAVTKQIATLGHVSNLYAAEPPIALAELLLALAGRVDLALGDSAYNRQELDALGFRRTGVFPIAVDTSRITVEGVNLAAR